MATLVRLPVVAIRPLPARVSGGLGRGLRVAKGVSARRTCRLSSCRAAPVAALDPHAAASAIQAAADHASNIVLHLADADGVAAGAASASAAVATDRSGFFNSIANGLEALLELIDGGLSSAGVPYSYGFSIILLTLFVKVITFPLTKKQMDSQMQMQAIAPRVKEVQAKYANDPERLQMETARLYRDANVNPLAGCLPTLATLPVFIGLYRALTNAAQDGLLTDGFFWIPSLGGPVALGADGAGGGLDWLFPLVDGAPRVGWADAGAYLVLPVLLIVSQYISQKIMSPQQNEDPSQQQAQAILKILPVMIGWFSLNVPSGLTLYWFTNNILTTAQTVYLRNAAKSNPVDQMPSSPASSATIDVVPSAPKQQSSRSVPPPKAIPGPKPGSRFAALKAVEQAQKKSPDGTSEEWSDEAGEGSSGGETAEGGASRAGGRGKAQVQRRGKSTPKGVKWVETPKEQQEESSV